MKLAISEDNTKIHWSLFLLVLFALGLYLRWPVPAPEWQHVDERAFILHPLGFWSGDLNPHFFNYPTLHFYLASALYYVYYFVGDFASLSSFVAYRYFVDGGDLVDLTRGFNSVLSSLTGVVCALIGRRLYGLWGGMAAGGLFSVLPLSVRFAHLAIVDVPLALWSLAALYFAVRVVQDGRLRDVLWGGIFAGLALATKYPGGLAYVPLGLACYWRFGLLRGPLWWSGLVMGGVFVGCSPYVLLDWSSAWVSISAMGSEHMLDEGHAGESWALWHHLRYNLRYGVGLLGMLALLVGLFGRMRAYRPTEGLVVAALVSWLVLLAVSSSVFMRYALPLAGLVVLLWVRGLSGVGGPMWLRWVLILVLGLEPLYGAYRTRSLLAGADTRVMAQRWINENAPPGTYLIHLNEGAGRLKAINPGGVYIRQNHYLEYFIESDLIESYRELSDRDDLPPLYVSINPRTGVEVVGASLAETPSHGLLIDYRHPLSRVDRSADSKKLLALGRWTAEFDPGPMAEEVYDDVDWYFLPIGSFGQLERTGPHIRIAVVPVKVGKRPIPMKIFFAALRDIFMAKKALERGDEEEALRLYQAVWSVPFSLDDTLSPEIMYDVLTNMGLGYSRRDDLAKAAQFWRAAIDLKPEHVEVYHNLGAIYAKMGQTDQAFAMWDQALARDPNRANTHYNRGNALYRKGDVEGAVASWTRAVELDSGFHRAFYNLGNAYFKLKELDRALAAYHKGLQHNFANGNIHYNIAQVHIQLGDDSEAIRYLRQSIEYNVQDSDAYYQLGGLYQKTAKSREARLSFERFLQLKPDHPKAEQVRQMLKQTAKP